ncbi:MAG: hypothetical protein Q4G70_15965 [Pseudomonadota bacterium]|nr:hypothetical protein [Pseudomonadota bacterium]
MNGWVVPRMPLGHRRFAAAAMALALAFQMLALVISTGHLARWLQLGSPDYNIVCTAVGMMRVLPGGELEPVPDAPDTATTAGNCFFCASAASQTGLALPPVHVAALPPSEAVRVALVTPVARLSWAPPHLRPHAHAPPRPLA